MNEISIRQVLRIEPYWLYYRKDDGEPAHIQLSACANNFAIHRPGQPTDDLKCVGVRYEEGGFGYYELFNVGHTKIKCPLKPGLLDRIRGKDPKNAYLEIERQLNANGWKTIEP